MARYGTGNPGYVGASSGPSMSRPRGNRFALLGDSITAQHGDAIRRNAKGYFHWAAAYLNQQIRYAVHFATGGYTTEQINTVHLPALLAVKDKWDYCAVLAGTNDVGNAVPVPTIIRNLSKTYKTIIAAGRVPVACTLPPRNGASAFQQGNIMNTNTGIKMLAAKLGIPLVDFHAALVNPTTADYTAGYNADQIHPNSLGARVMGKMFADTMTGIGATAPWRSPLSVAVNDPANFLSNPLFTLDSNSDGVPDRWTVHAASGATFSLEDPAGGEPVAGKWFKCTRATDSGATTTYRVATLAGVQPGDRVAVSLKFKATLEGSPAGKFGLMIFKDKDVNTPLLGLLHDWDRDTQLCTIYGEFLTPVGVTGLQVDCNFSGAGTVWLGQMTFRNLTAAGLNDL
ncbi:SGNH/GDSL hydrolase family protein [Paenibacillus ehimensis]|uniref:SGNH/GDSL hydrolase family protein n=1 Tax=Paenibacillus ehimensis TaxID=79264 RepID=A0ABT8VLY8_9BACL|nr:SGNH/GDSL hydrolase family protein [Paenibacillus ehimensis]MDO3681976.1 SGNH/GDSL hydrolase family protein [Paenibacillus ehimensis]